MDDTTFQLECNKNENGKEYKFKKICDNIVYTKESKSYLPGLYYLVFGKGYFKEKNTWEPILVV